MMTLNDAEVRRWTFLPRRFVQRNVAEEGRLLRSAVDATITNNSCADQDGALTKKLQSLNAWDSVLYQWIAGSDDWDHTQNPLRQWSFTIIGNSFAVMHAAAHEGVIEGQLPHAALSRNIEVPVGLARHANTGSAEVWIVEVEGWGKGTQTQIEKRFAEISEKEHHWNWLPISFGLVAFPSNRKSPWLVAYNRSADKFDDYNRFHRFVFPELAMRLQRCDLYGQALTSELLSLRLTESELPSGRISSNKEHEHVLSQLEDLDRKMQDFNLDLLTLRRNREGIEALITHWEMFDKHEHRWLQTATFAATNIEDQAAYDIECEKVRYNALLRREQTVGTRAMQKLHTFHKVIAIVGSFFAAASVGLLVPEKLPWDPDNYLVPLFVMKWVLTGTALGIMLLLVRKFDK